MVAAWVKDVATKGSWTSLNKKAFDVQAVDAVNTKLEQLCPSCGSNGPGISQYPRRNLCQTLLARPRHRPLLKELGAGYRMISIARVAVCHAHEDAQSAFHS